MQPTFNSTYSSLHWSPRWRSFIIIIFLLSESFWNTVGVSLWGRGGGQPEEGLFVSSWVWTGSCPVDQTAESEAGQNPEGRLRMRCSAGIRWNWTLFCFTDRGRIILSRWYRFKQMLHASVSDLHVQIRYWVESWVRVGVCMESESSSTIRTCAVS